jgi:MFS family permease
MEHLGFGRFQLTMLAVLGLANASDAVELLCLSFILPLLKDEAGAPLPSSARAALSSGIFVGMLAGGLVFGIAADSLGRRATLAASLGINFFFGLLAAASPRYEALLACRVLAGFGVGGSIPGIFTLAAELLPTLDRGFWLSTVAWWWMVGAIYTAGLAWALLGSGASWQAFAAACALPAGAAAALVLLLLPESPRYLHTSARSAEGARAALLRIARVTGVASRLGGGDCQGRGHLHLEACPPPAAGAKGSSGSSGSSGSRGSCLPCSLAPVRAFFLAPAHRRPALLLACVWFCLSFGWYGLFAWLPTLFRAARVQLDIYQDSFIVAAAFLPGNLASALLMERIGRRGVLAGSLLLACLCAIAFPYAATEATVLLAACTLNAVSTCSWNSLDCLSVESFPTALRTTALGLLAAVGRLGSIAGQWVFGSLVEVSVVALLGIAGAVLGAGAGAAWLLPQEGVRSQRLQETSGAGGEEGAAAAQGSGEGAAGRERGEL